MSGRGIEEFITRWSPSGGGERSNYQLFLTELCDLLGVPTPEPALPDDTKNAYVFDRSIQRQEADGSKTPNFIDLYKHGCFICETKQGVEKKEGQSALSKSVKLKKGHGIRGTGTWDTAMEKARNQASQYARALPPSEGRPPFLLVVDVGYSIELFAEFTCTGGTYVRFPDPKAHRILLTDLRDEKKRETLKNIWTEPLALDPARRSAKVTREIADQLAQLASLFKGHDDQVIAEFLMRCIFTMFAEDVRLLPQKSFTRLLESLKGNLRGFPVMVEALWKDMANGSHFSTVIREKVLHFNGGLFESATALPVTAEQLDLLIAAARADWRDVEPAIFGTLLERALSPRERHKLGAHYTPRAYVERLVFPTVIDPLRAEWESVKTATARLQSDREEVETRYDELHQRYETAVKARDSKAVRALEKEEKKLKRPLKEAREAVLKPVREYHHALCKTRVLDPACGSGNFLYVTMEHMKRLEGEALELLTELGDPQLETEMREFKVRPHQFIGLEINPWAVPIAELVLWIGYLQWHFRTSDKAVPDDPVISKEHSIHLQDAVLAYDKKEMITWAMARENPDLPGLPDDVRAQLRSQRSHGRESMDQTSGRAGSPLPAANDDDLGSGSATGARGATRPTASPSPTQVISVWDGRTMKAHPVTGKDVPDDTARVPLWHYVNPRKAEWPEADYIIGNPPFVGNKRMRSTLGDSYVECLRLLEKGPPESADLVMFWWNKAATLLKHHAIRRFGFITTNSLTQPFNRKCMERFLGDTKDCVRIAFAVPDHPWVDSTNGADVRIAMTVICRGTENGTLASIIKEKQGSESEVISSQFGKIHADLTIGANLTDLRRLIANSSLACPGVQLSGQGFIVNPGELGAFPSDTKQRLIRPYVTGRDLMQKSKSRFVIDTFGSSEQELREQHPEVYQWLLQRVKPDRTAIPTGSKDVADYAKNWWLHAKPRSEFRKSLYKLSRYIGTSRTARHRTFQFLDAGVLAETKVLVFAFDSAYVLGVLSSRLHIHFATAAGSWLGVGNDSTYNHTRCFEPFPFPDPDEATRERIRELGEQLDGHRKRQQALHPGLTLTGMYNVLEKLRAMEVGRVAPRAPSGAQVTTEPSPSAPGRQGTASPTNGLQLTAKEKEIHEQGLVSVLKQIHDDLDAAVFEAYGWGPRPGQAKAASGGGHLSDEEILERLVALNHTRAEEEKRGHIRWLRPDFQNPGGTSPASPTLNLPEEKQSADRGTRPSAKKKPAWPTTLAEQVEAVHKLLESSKTPATTRELAKQFLRANKERIDEILQTLVTLGKARKTKDGRFQG